MTTWKELLKSGATYLETNNVDDFLFEATQLLLTFFQSDYNNFLLHSSDSPDLSQIDSYNNLLKRRVEGEPLQYILGKWDFYNSEFFVGKGVLIPRPETEELVDRCIALIRKNNYKVIYDLCTGTGCIGISVAKECPDVKCYLFELYDEAFSYAQKNINSCGVSNVTLIRHDVLEAYKGAIPDADMIISNPPYIESDEIATLQKEVLEEPLTALDGGTDGLVFYRRFLSDWTERLNVSGYFAFECGENQTDAIASLADDRFITETKKDIYGNNRFVYLHKVKEDNKC